MKPAMDIVVLMLQDGVAVRSLDWSTALAASHDAPPHGSSSGADAAAQHACARTDGSTARPEAEHETAADDPPQLPPDAQYQVHGCWPFCTIICLEHGQWFHVAPCMAGLAGPPMPMLQ